MLALVRYEQGERMTDRELIQDALEAMESAIKSGDWKVDGACDPEVILVRLRNRLEQPPASWPYTPEQLKREWVGFTHEELAWLNEALNLGGRFAVIEAIEAKLKEKNGG